MPGEPDPLAYESFNAFFTRELAAGARPMPQDPASVASPVDGTISQIGYLEGQSILQAKGRRFSLAALLGGSAAESAQFAGGAFATLYLAPYNYHRIHMPLERAAAHRPAYSRQPVQRQCRHGGRRGGAVRPQRAGGVHLG